MGILSFFKDRVEAVNYTDNISKNAHAQKMSDLVAQIHREFLSRGEQRLKEAQAVVDANSGKNTSKGEALQALGFWEAKPVVERKIVQEKLRTSNQLIKDIMYFHEKYPQYKVISKDDIMAICDKYNLVFGPASHYKGDIPDKNVADIQAFKLDDEDKSYTLRYGNTIVPYREGTISMKKAVSQKWADSNIRMDTPYSPATFSMAAPQKDFNMTGMEVKGRQIVQKHIPDPVVFYPLGRDLYMIVTAWGDEAEDELVKNGTTVK